MDGKNEVSLCSTSTPLFRRYRISPLVNRVEDLKTLFHSRIFLELLLSFTGPVPL
jgi:hypothetical protein